MSIAISVKLKEISLELARLKERVAKLEERLEKKKPGRPPRAIGQ